MNFLERLRALRRFTLFRWQAAVHIAWPLVICARMVVDWTPANFAAWPPSAQQATRELIQGAYWLVFAGWLGASLSPLVWLDNPRWRFVVRVASGVALGCCTLVGLIELLAGLVALPAFPTPGVRAITLATARVVGVPVLLGLLPLGWYWVHERLSLLPFLRRWFHAGQGATGGFMTGQELRKYTRPLPRKLL